MGTKSRIFFLILSFNFIAPGFALSIDFDDKLYYYIGGGVGAALGLLVLLICLCCVRRNRNPGPNVRPPQHPKRAEALRTTELAKQSPAPSQRLQADRPANAAIISVDQPISQRSPQQQPHFHMETESRRNPGTPILSGQHFHRSSPRQSQARMGAERRNIATISSEQPVQRSPKPVERAVTSLLDKFEASHYPDDPNNIITSFERIHAQPTESRISTRQNGKAELEHFDDDEFPGFKLNANGGLYIPPDNF